MMRFEDATADHDATVSRFMDAVQRMSYQAVCHERTQYLYADGDAYLITDTPQRDRPLIVSATRSGKLVVAEWIPTKGAAA